MKKNKPFNQMAATWTIAAVIAAWIISVGTNRFYNQKEIPLIGSLIYGILGLFASIITGFIVQQEKRKINEQEDIKNGKRTITVRNSEKRC